MDNPGYTTLTRQMGLAREMQVIANNIANMATTGFRQEGVIFSEYVSDTKSDDSLSMANGNVRNTSFAQGTLSATGGTFDLAIEGEGYFLIETPRGERLTRAGHFTPNQQGELVTPDGFRVLDPGGAPVFIPPGADVAFGADGTISANGTLVGQIGVVRPLDPTGLQREDGVMFVSEGGQEPAEGARIAQRFLEASNVNPILQMARMIEVQRAYELGQSFAQSEDERIRNVVRTLGE